ncbi:MAG: M16 family metallopeptidase [Rhodospirillales bacterium]
MTPFKTLAAAAAVAVMAASAEAFEIERVTSPGGIEAWLIRDRTAPVLAIQAAIPGGSSQDPAGKEGLANLMTGMLDEGAGPYDSQAFKARIEDRSIEISADADRDYLTVGVRALSDRRDEAVELLALALTEPRFAAADLERVRGQALAQIQRDAENPRSIAWRTLWGSLFPGHPYARRSQGTIESVNAITRDDMAAFHRAALSREGLKIGVVGDISPEELKPLIDRAFGKLPATSTLAKVPEAGSAAPGTVTVVRRAIPQSVVTFGHFGLKRDDPDYYAALAVNYVLGGGGQSSRLMEEVREKRGLAYSIASTLSTLRHAGLVLGMVGTENAETATSIELVRKEWRRMRDQGPSETELNNAKTYLTGSFPLQMSSTGRIARLLVAIQTENLGIDYLRKRNSYIEKVTLEDARRVAKRLYDPDKLTVVVVGDPAGMPVN